MKKGIDAFFPVIRGISTLEEAMDPKTAGQNLADTAEQGIPSDQSEDYVIFIKRKKAGFLRHKIVGTDRKKNGKGEDPWETGNRPEGWSRKIYLELTPPSPEDNVSDQERIKRALREEYGEADCSLQVLRKFYPLCSQAD